MGVSSGLLFITFFSNTHAMIACQQIEKCIENNKVLVVLPVAQLGQTSKCPSPIPEPGTYKKDKKLKKLWPYKAPHKKMCWGNFYVSADGATIIENDGLSIDVIQRGELIKTINYTDINIKMTDPGNMAVDLFPSYDGTIKVESTDEKGFTVSNGKGQKFNFDWKGKLQP